MIVVFMFFIMTKRLSPLTALVVVPLVFAVVALATGSVPANSFVNSDGETMSALAALGQWVKDGIKTTSNTGIMIMFAVLYFATMLDAGLFDPITRKLIMVAKGDPMKIIMATAVVAGVVSMNGDGTTTTLICCSAFLPIYKKLDMKLMNLGVLIILQNTILNLLPWSGPTSRAMAVLGVGSDILAYLMPGMILSLLFVIFIVAPSMGRAERKRLGVKEMTPAELEDLLDNTDPETAAIRRPKCFAFNGILTIVVIAWLVAGSFIPEIELPSQMIFIVGTCIALLVNYPNLSDQSDRISANGGDALQAVILVFAAGVFMGLFQGSGMATALAQSLINIIPEQLGGFWSIFVAIISVPGTFFLSNDGFYFGVLPPLAEAGFAYGFTPMQIALASLMGQAFHLLSPLVAFIYLLLRYTGLDMGEWQRQSAKWAVFIFIILCVTIILGGQMPVYLAQ